MSATVLGLGVSSALELICEMIKVAGCDGKLVLEFHSLVSTHGDDAPYNWEDGLQTFYETNEKANLYSVYLDSRGVDAWPAALSYAAKISNEWYVAVDCGANYYSGTGPGTARRFREFCKKNNIRMVPMYTSLDDWLLAHGYNLAEAEESPPSRRLMSAAGVSLSRRQVIVRDLADASANLARSPRKAVTLAEWALLEVLVLLVRHHNIDIDEMKERNGAKLLGKLIAANALPQEEISRIQAAYHIRNKAAHNLGPVELNEAESVILTVQFLLQKYGDLLMPDAEQAECITVLAPQPANPTT